MKKIKFLTAALALFAATSLASPTASIAQDNTTTNSTNDNNNDRKDWGWIGLAGLLGLLGLKRNDRDRDTTRR